MISEATPVLRQGYGYADAPGIYDDIQIAGWRAVTDAVRARGGQIVMQPWHLGGQSRPDIQPNSYLPDQCLQDGPTSAATISSPHRERSGPRALPRLQLRPPSPRAPPHDDPRHRQNCR